MIATPSVARGLLAGAVLAAGVILTQAFLRPLPERGEPEPACAEPVELAGERPRLGCATEAREQGCAGARAGDRVLLTADGCKVEAQGMSAAMRLVLGRKLELNRASPEELALLEGIGPVLAERIVRYRAAHGPFADLAGLTEVQGIGEVTLAKLTPFLEVGSNSAERP